MAKPTLYTREDSVSKGQDFPVSVFGPGIEVLAGNHHAIPVYVSPAVKDIIDAELYWGHVLVADRIITLDDGAYDWVTPSKVCFRIETQSRGIIFMFYAEIVATDFQNLSPILRIKLATED